MPGNLDPSEPSLLMPMTLAAQFQEIHLLDALVDEYADGRSTRRALALNARRGFRLTRPLTAFQLDDLRGFYMSFARYGRPFWFYNVRESVPPYTWDDTGSNPLGRYTVVWEGGWNETLGVSRHASSFILREVD